ncbi:hypothetical protein CAJAP_06983 [Camponotus japonicus]
MQRATTQKSTKSKTPSTKYDGDNAKSYHDRADVTRGDDGDDRINQVVRREVAKERKKIKREEFQRRKVKYATRIPPIPAPPVYVPPFVSSPIPTSFYVPTYAPSTYAAPFTYAPPTYAAPAHPQPPPYAAPTHPQPPPYGTPNVIFSPYAHMYRTHF